MLYIARIIDQKFPDDADTYGPFLSERAAIHWVVGRVAELYPQEYYECSPYNGTPTPRVPDRWNAYARNTQALPLVAVSGMLHPDSAAD